MPTDTETPHEAIDSPYPAYNFEVRIGEDPVAGFTSVSGLTVEVETVEYREGGRDEHAHRLPAGTSHGTLTLEGGLTRETTLFDWVQAVAGGTVRRKPVVLKLLGEAGSATCWGWECSGAYPVCWSGPDLRASGGGMAIESVELVYERLSRLPGTPE